MFRSRLIFLLFTIVFNSEIGYAQSWIKLDLLSFPYSGLGLTYEQFTSEKTSLSISGSNTALGTRCVGFLSDKKVKNVGRIWNAYAAFKYNYRFSNNKHVIAVGPSLEYIRWYNVSDTYKEVYEDEFGKERPSERNHFSFLFALEYTFIFHRSWGIGISAPYPPRSSDTKVFINLAYKLNAKQWTKEQKE